METTRPTRERKPQRDSDPEWRRSRGGEWVKSDWYTRAGRRFYPDCGWQPAFLVGQGNSCAGALCCGRCSRVILTASDLARSQNRPSAP